MAYPISKTLAEYYWGDVVHTETSSQWGRVLQLWDAYENGVSLITTNLASLQTSIRGTAIQGKSAFTVSLSTSYQTNNLKLRGDLLNSYLAGVAYALQDEGIYDYEVVISLNTADSSDTKVDLAFDFA